MIPCCEGSSPCAGCDDPSVRCGGRCGCLPGNGASAARAEAAARLCAAITLVPAQGVRSGAAPPWRTTHTPPRVRRADGGLRCEDDVLLQEKAVAHRHDDPSHMLGLPWNGVWLLRPVLLLLLL
eukprot:Rhum_TRINITY_DN14981_c2_g1::Rhum_TRINITY_DN14981_c2_g1_i3::g.130581::m.130581